MESSLADTDVVVYCIALDATSQLIKQHNQLSKEESYNLYDNCKTLLKLDLQEDEMVKEEYGQVIKSLMEFVSTYPNPNNK